MKCSLAFFCGVLSMTVLITGLAFGKDLPPEVKAFRDMAISASKEVCISGEKLKADYTVLEADENRYEGTYQVADFPQKGVQATLLYRVTPEAIAKVLEAAGKTPIRETAEEYKARRARLHELRKNFPKPFPETVVCVEEKAGVQTKYRFLGASLSAYMKHFDGLTQATVIWFHPKATNVVWRFYKIQNDAYTGVEYEFDMEGNITKAVDHGPPPSERRSSIGWNEYTQKFKLFSQEDAFEILGGKEFFESPAGKAFLKSPDGKEAKDFLESPEGKKLMETPAGKDPAKKDVRD